MSAIAEPHGKQVEEIGLHRVDARVHLYAARKQVEHARRIPFTREDRLPIRGRDQVEQGLGMNQGMMAGESRPMCR